MHKPVIAILLAGGTGQRFGHETPKQYMPLGGKMIIDHALNALQSNPRIDEVIIVIAQGQTIPYPHFKHVIGGKTRRESVYNALQAITLKDASVLIHDSARPFLYQDSLDRLIDAHAGQHAASLSIPVVDTLRHHNGETVPRDNLQHIQTPQIFDLHTLKKAHETVTENVTDDAALMHAHGCDVLYIQGDQRNFKITTESDYRMAQQIIGADIRVGNGYDVHAIDTHKSYVTLCGITFDNNFGLTGHSDADVGLHALTDAIYGACGAGDIGRHFPPSDMQWKDADSAQFLTHAIQTANQMGGRLNHVDITLICEAPKLKPHYDAMKQRLAQLIQLDVSRIGLKATTSEQLGFTGRGEGIAAQATATVVF